MSSTGFVETTPLIIYSSVGIVDGKAAVVTWTVKVCVAVIEVSWLRVAVNVIVSSASASELAFDSSLSVVPVMSR